MTSSPRSLALVTGGSRGLGHQICLQLREQGFQVQEFSRAAPHPWSVMLDLGRPQDIRPTLDRALGDLDLDGLDRLVVVGNAGSGLLGKVALAALGLAVTARRRRRRGAR